MVTESFELAAFPARLLADSSTVFHTNTLFWTATLRDTDSWSSVLSGACKSALLTSLAQNKLPVCMPHNKRRSGWISCDSFLISCAAFRSPHGTSSGGDYCLFPVATLAIPCAHAATLPPTERKVAFTLRVPYPMQLMSQANVRTPDCTAREAESWFRIQW